MEQQGRAAQSIRKIEHTALAAYLLSELEKNGVVLTPEQEKAYYDAAEKYAETPAAQHFSVELANAFHLAP